MTVFGDLGRGAERLFAGVLAAAKTLALGKCKESELARAILASGRAVGPIWIKGVDTPIGKVDIEVVIHPPGGRR